MGGGSGAFVTISGVASDDVAGLQVLLSDRQTAAVPLADNAFLVDVPRAKLPARLVAYDEADHVVAVSDPWFDVGGGSAPANGRAVPLLRVRGSDGSKAELLVGRSTDGGECMYVKHFVDPQRTGTMIGCKGPGWTGSLIQVDSQFRPPRFIGGRVRTDVMSVRIASPTNGSEADANPRLRALGGLRATPFPASGRDALEGMDANGNVVARISRKPPRRSSARVARIASHDAVPNVHVEFP
jgi:hypothetical protein